MSTIDDGGPAFPMPNDDRPGAYEAHPGMSLRDWFAGQAAAAIECGVRASYGGIPPSHLARRAYAIADAMLAARRGGADG